MAHKTLIIIGVLIYPVIAFLFFCLLGFNGRGGECLGEPGAEPERDLDNDKKLENE